MSITTIRHEIAQIWIFKKMKIKRKYENVVTTKIMKITTVSVTVSEQTDIQQCGSTHQWQNYGKCEVWKCSICNLAMENYEHAKLLNTTWYVFLALYCCWLQAHVIMWKHIYRQ